MSTATLLQTPVRILERLPRFDVVLGTVPRLSNIAFTMLVVGLGAFSLLSSLVINVALTQGAFQEAALTREVRGIEAQQQAAQQTLAMLGSPGALESRARAMGMVPVAAPVFLRLSDGKVLGKPMPAERGDQPTMIDALMPQFSFLNPELQMAAAVKKSVPVQPRSDAAVELPGVLP